MNMQFKLGIAALFFLALNLSTSAQINNPGISVTGVPANNDCAKFVVSGGVAQSITTTGAGCAAGGTPGGADTQVQYNNAGAFGGLTNTQLTARINAATAALSGALPAWPNTATSFFRGDGTYATLNCAALSNAGALCSVVAGTGVATALAVNVGAAGAPVLFNGAGGTPASLALANATGLPCSTGIASVVAAVCTWMLTPSSANLRAAITDETGTGVAVFNAAPNFTGTVTMDGALNIANSPAQSTNGQFNIGTTASKATVASTAISINSVASDAPNAIHGFMQVTTDPTAANRRLSFGIVEDGIAWRNITFAESGGNVCIGCSVPNGLLDVRGTVFMPNLTTSAATQNGYVCWKTTNGELINDSGTCLVSSMRFKDRLSDFSDKEGLALVSALHPFSFVYKEGNGKVFVGLSAEEMAEHDARFATFEKDGSPHGIHYDLYTAALTAAIRELKSELDDLRAELRSVKR